ncbi:MULTISPECIES: hypothetical protein [unclassified Sphingopyxis]|uniref:hypothetical protein n=1 Tax=unclassified Sphingopyxis TaxID=2614943 RepID=UPI000730849A|nr:MULTISPECIES: hypothetical protein [unclassified Sphingopyxis]KTE24423.1 hypothetical protein ATE61_13535 [Sphingopyxis sp. H057]KTE50951.1 hypothetical protein ATE69_17235 [Sphingopyxis sp. H071]KTE52094.1 hypothetical protein ATE64_11840 [Sphingopyxis sp. H073]KTE60573.1 hypothetical protein ATE66_08305 [Sphingopyxis sp. H107]KTE63838.1 hypothetical protein ATE65_13630 [Sphingopyxis sp. H100]
MKVILPIMGAALALSACTAPAPVEEAQATPAKPEPAAPAPAAIEAAKTALASEPKIKDLSYDATNTVQWNVGVLDDGSRRTGYAQYVCQVLQEKGALAGRTHVRIVDIAKVAQGSDFRDANLGHVICETGDIVDT